jgi:hypothetical protein
MKAEYMIYRPADIKNTVSAIDDSGIAQQCRNTWRK